MLTLPIVLNIGLTIFFITQKGSRGTVWLLQIFYWVLVFIIFGIDHLFEYFIGSVLLAEFQLGWIYQKFGKFYWSFSWAIIIGFMHLLSHISNANGHDLLVILEIIVIGIIIALLTMLSLEKGFMNIFSKQNSNEV